MDNPWKHINLDDYENHMKLASVMQLQAMNEMMQDQFYRYAVSIVMILGVAGGNGLNHIKSGTIKKIYGVDINPLYLKECADRYDYLKDILQVVEANLLDKTLALPYADLVIANLFIEYIGYDAFKRAISIIKPKYVSCGIQINTDSGFVSDSPYLYVFEHLDEVHRQMSESDLTQSMKTIGYELIFTAEKLLPNGKKLVRMDYQSTKV